MHRITGCFALAIALMLAGCTQSGPQQALDRLAQALETNNPQAFMQVMDMNAYAANYISNITDSNDALGSLNAIGNLLGLGNLDKLLGSVVDFGAMLNQRFMRGVASGELMAQCRKSDKPDCPWLPQSLKKAQVVMIGDNAAIAKVTTPQNMASWLALRKTGQDWKVVGQAVLEGTARIYATGQAPAQGGTKI